jgi:hypothetical protein
VSRRFLLTAMAAVVASGCLTSGACGLDRGKHARTRASAQNSAWSSTLSDLSGYHLGSTSYAPHGWFGYDPTRSSYGWTDSCFGLAGPYYHCTYHPEVGTQREPIPFHW